MSEGDGTESKGGMKVSASSSRLVQDAVASLNADKEWPRDVVVYTSLEEQELLPDIARGYVVKALLAVNGLADGYNVERRHNAEFMAPKSGKLPFLRMPNKVVAQEDFLDFMYTKSFVLKNDLSVEDNMIMQGIISLIETKLIPIELYCVWIDPINRKKTLDQYGFDYPQPLKKILCWKKFKQVEKHLKSIGLLEKSEQQIKEELCGIYQCIARKLEVNSHITGDDMTEADVYVYGHLQAILESKLENNMLMKALEEYPKLTNFCLNFNQLHLGNKAMIWEFL